ncbi:hypothetical protein RvY_16353 [Ramazzottius varieornatus]|uniref:Maleylacetoacetate isomerase n=1 Tax=Ramazzottius varieornatus TaxID=947166 RepID=A0A1D1W4K4_RAMVA|nr:hypothetical protein RvY_16353 [Ramazzottius varieornatus]
MQQVPAQLINKQCLTQSLAIIEYLDEVFPERPLLPKDPLQRFIVRQISETFASGIQPLQNLGCLLKVSHQKEKRIEFAAYFIRKGFDALEKLLKDTSSKYCVGDYVAMADLCLIPQAAAAERYNVSLDEYPTIQRIFLALSELQPMKKAHAFGQEDCPAEWKFEGALKSQISGRNLKHSLNHNQTYFSTFYLYDIQQ